MPTPGPLFLRWPFTFRLCSMETRRTSQVPELPLDACPARGPRWCLEIATYLCPGFPLDFPDFQTAAFRPRQSVGFPAASFPTAGILWTTTMTISGLSYAAYILATPSSAHPLSALDWLCSEHKDARGITTDLAGRRRLVRWD